MSDQAIFIFTRDNPKVLTQTIRKIVGWPGKINIIDDSTIFKNQIVCQEFASLLGIQYLGGAEFDSFLAKYDFKSYITDFLLRRPGHSEWNLGCCRNFALLYALSKGYDKVLFLDEDIAVANLGIIEGLLNGLNGYKFTGAHIKGLIDDSILGHIATDLGVTNPRMLSGGCLAFRPSVVDHYFMNNYNEDWIWLFLQVNKRNYLQKYEVHQEIKDPFDHYQHKIQFQEIGEILLDGILDIYPENDTSKLVSLAFWERILDERLTYLNELKGLAKKANLKRYILILEKLIINHSEQSPANFQNLFITYFSRKETFNAIKKALLPDSFSIA